MNKKNPARHMRRFAGLMMFALASTLLNGCILTQILGGVAGQGGVLGGPGQVTPGAGQLTGSVPGSLPGAPGTTTPGALVPLAANLQPAVIQQIQGMDVDIQNRQARLATLVRDRDEYVRRSQARQPNDPLLAQEQALVAQRNQEINTEQAQLNEIVGRRNRLASGQPA